MGERTTGDFRLELSGKKDKLGYYLSADGLTSDGLRPHTGVDSGSAYSKLTWEPTDETRLLATLGYAKGSRGYGSFDPFNTTSDGHYEQFFATVALSHALTESLDLDLSGRFSKRNTSATETDQTTGAEWTDTSYREPNLGASAKLAWRVGGHSLNLGTDYDNGTMHADSRVLDPFTGHETRKKTDGRLERWALFANDTYVWKVLSITPGIRYDWTSTNGDFVSPSLGITLNWSDHTVFRAYVTRGFSIPPLVATTGAYVNLEPNSDLKVERVWSYQAGFESSLLRHLWLKGTMFRHEISDAIGFDDVQPIIVNKGKQRRQGVEVEARTVPLFNTFVTAGYTFVDARDRDTDKILRNVPRHTADVGLHYNDRTWLRGSLTGRYVWFNADSYLDARYTAMIWDLSLSAKVVESHLGTGEIFFVAHNLFDGAQYQDAFYENPGRWFEGGVRFRF
jgi:vitamin B12 transporter